MVLNWRNRGFLLIGIISFILISVFLLFFLIFPGIQANYKPENVLVSSTGQNTFTVSFFTKQDSKSSIEISKDNSFSESTILYDVRDIMNGEAIDSIEQGKRYLHYFIPKNLEPDTKYYFKIQTYLNTTYEEKIFQATTAKVVEEVPVPIPMYGSVLDQDGSGKSDILIEAFAELGDGIRSSTITTYTNNEGNYSLDLANLRSFNLEKYWVPDNGVPSKIVVIAKDREERYSYEIFNGEYEPVKNFIFEGKSVDEEGSLFSPVIANENANNLCNPDW